MARSFDALIAERGLHNTTKHKICGIWCWKPCGNGAQSHMEYSAGDHGRACSHGCSNRFRDTPTIRRSRPHINQGRTSTQIAHQSRLYAGPDCAPIQTGPVRTPTQTAHQSRPYAGPLGDRGVLALHAGGSQRTRPRESAGAKAYARRVTRATAFFTMKMASSNATESSTMVPPGFRPRTYERMSPSTAEPTPTALEMTQV